ncbi:MAG: AI-2E family transporter [Bacteroidia bacterium]|nr:AI-2E family transporter [Bacteroidia bacterium]
MSPIRAAAWLVILTLLVYILIIGKNLLIPLVAAFSIWYLVYSLAELIRKASFKGKRLPLWAAMCGSLVVIIALLIAVIDIIEVSVEDMIELAPAYQEAFQALIQKGMKLFRLDTIPTFNQILEQVDIRPIAQSVGEGVSSFAGNMVLMLVYLIFILAEQFVFERKLRALASSNSQYEQILGIMGRVHQSLKSYVAIKTGVSVLTGLISWVILAIVGVEFAIFWAFLIFLLNYIPTLGSLVGTFFPAIFALIQFDTATPFLAVLIGVGATQFLVGNVLEPRLMGKTLNVSGLVVILSLSVWGVIWGVVGMVLSVPIVVTLVIILGQFPQTRAIAVLLSARGNVAPLEKK